MTRSQIKKVKGKNKWRLGGCLKCGKKLNIRNKYHWQFRTCNADCYSQSGKSILLAFDEETIEDQ